MSANGPGQGFLLVVPITSFEIQTDEAGAASPLGHWLTILRCRSEVGFPLTADISGPKHNVRLGPNPDIDRRRCIHRQLSLRTAGSAGIAANFQLG